MADKFQSSADTLFGPSRRSVSIAPSDSAPLTDVPKGVYVGTGGDITGRLVDNAADTVWKNVPSGALLPFRFTYIRAAGTSAADLVAHY